MSPRASWKGFLKIAEVTVPVGLYAAASTSERIALHTINRPTGHRVHREFVDAETGEAVDRDEQVKGYEVAKGEYVSVEPDEIAAVIPHGDKTLTVSAFVDLADVDDLYFDKPYFVAPSDRSADEPFAVVREGMRKAKVAAVAQAVLFRRVRTVLIRPLENGLAATTLHYDYEVRSAERGVLGCAKEGSHRGDARPRGPHHQDQTRRIRSAATFEDRYEDALAELVKLKLEGKAIPKRAPAQERADSQSHAGVARERSRRRVKPSRWQSSGEEKDWPARRCESQASRAATQGELTNGARNLSEEAQFRRHHGTQGLRGAHGQRHLRRPET